MEHEKRQFKILRVHKKSQGLALALDLSPPEVQAVKLLSSRRVPCSWRGLRGFLGVGLAGVGGFVLGSAKGASEVLNTTSSCLGAGLSRRAVVRCGILCCPWSRLRIRFPVVPQNSFQNDVVSLESGTLCRSLEYAVCKEHNSACIASHNCRTPGSPMSQVNKRTCHCELVCACP